MYFGQTPPLSNHDRCDLWEIYSMPRLGPCIRSLGGQSRRSYDIQHFWDLASGDYKRLVIQDLSLLRPKFIMLSPPCRFVSLLMASNWSRMARISEKMLCLEEALGHLDMSMWMAGFQLIHKALFAFEHPIGSLAWTRDSETSSWLSAYWIVSFFLSHYLWDFVGIVLSPFKLWQSNKYCPESN